jgi:16S rRNA G966 N2-methylase RsmD
VHHLGIQIRKTEAIYFYRCSYKAFERRTLSWKTLLKFVQINLSSIDFERRSHFMVADENRNRTLRAVNRKSMRAFVAMDPPFYNGGNHDLSNADEVV